MEVDKAVSVSLFSKDQILEYCDFLYLVKSTFKLYVDFRN